MELKIKYIVFSRERKRTYSLAFYIYSIYT